VDSLSIPVVTDDPALIVDAVKIRVPRSGCIQLLPGFGLSVQGLGEEKIASAYSLNSHQLKRLINAYRRSVAISSNGGGVYISLATFGNN